MATRYWLVKQEPEAYPWSQLVADKKTAWTGVRNFQARNHLRAMKIGDKVLYYHNQLLPQNYLDSITIIRINFRTIKVFLMITTKVLMMIIIMMMILTRWM